LTKRSLGEKKKREKSLTQVQKGSISKIPQMDRLSARKKENS